MISKVIKTPAVSEEQMENQFKALKLKKKVTIDQMIQLMRSYLPNQDFDVKLLVKVCGEIHKKFKKIQLKPKECWVVIMASGILPSEKIVGKEKFAVALGRALKYIILRKA